MTIEMIKKSVANKLDEFARCKIHYQKEGDKHMFDLYSGGIIALESLLEKIISTELEELYDGQN